MSNFAVLRRVELPLAIPVIMAGIRTALVLLVGTAALATFINAGGLGGILTAGITLYRYSVMVAGAVLVALPGSKMMLLRPSGKVGSGVTVTIVRIPAVADKYLHHSMSFCG